MKADAATPLHTTVDSPLGELLLLGDERTLRGLRILDGARPALPGERGSRAEEPFAEARDQLGAYFAGERRGFDLPLAPAGTAFQRRVWAALTEIPYGETISYTELARRAGRPRAIRAAGAANARNPLAIVVPCHRVVGSGQAPQRRRASASLRSASDQASQRRRASASLRSASDGGLTGYAGGLERKRLLLDLEAGRAA